MSDSTIALFPLNMVLLPGQVLPLHIFEPRYRQLINDLLEREDPQTRAFGIVAIREGHEVGDDAARALNQVGTMALVHEVERYADGEFDVITIGGDRFSIDSLEPADPYLRANVTWLNEPAGEAGQSLTDAVRQSFIQYWRNLNWGDQVADFVEFDEFDEHDVPDDPHILSYFVAAELMLDQSDLQGLLEAPDDTARLKRELALLRRESALAIHLRSIPAGDFAHTAISLN